MKRFTAFIREKGFYLALLACILAAAASSVWAIRTVVGRLNGTAESQSSSEEEFVWDAPELPVERSAEDVPIEPNELRGSSPSSLPEATSSSPSGGQEGSGQQAASPEVSSAWPVPGPMLTPFSGDELVYNETLGDWRTHNGVDLAAKAGEPVKAVTDDGSSIQDSFFSAVTQDDGNVYFTLTDGSVITVAKRMDFYLILRKAPDVAPFVYGETKTYEIESAGVAETILTKPDGWRVALKDDVLSVTAPAADAASFEAEGTVAVIYFDGAERSSVAKLGVVVDKSQTGVTEGDDFTIDITEVTDKSVTATVTPKDASIYYYVSAYDAETFDEKGEAAVVAELKAMFDFYVQYGMWDYYKETLMSKGTATYTTPEATPLTAGASYYLIAFGLEENSEGTALIPNTAVMKVPFKTTTPVVVNTKYRVTVDNITWYGAGYSVVPSDDLHYFHGIVKKSAFTGGQGQPLTDAEVAAAYVKEYETRYYDELYMDDPTTIKWTDLSSCGTQRQVVPRAWIRENELANEAIRPLVAETDYCLIAFGVDGKELRTDVAKKEFRTPAFTPTEECTFDLDVTVSRQNLSIKVTPSNKNLTYICHLDKSATYYEFENDMQYAADDLFWTKYNLEAGRTLSDELLTGDIEMKAENLWASTGYVVYAYGCTADGVITTPLTSVRVLTEAGSDTPPATAAKPRLVRVR